MSNDSPLNALASRVVEINRANGWNVVTPEDSSDPYKIPAVLMLIVSEVAEALEAFRITDGYGFREELADVLIRVLDLAAGFGVDMDAEVEKKLAKNMQRGYRHGGKRVMKRCRHPRFWAGIATPSYDYVLWCPDCGALRRPGKKRWDYPERRAKT